MLRIEGWVIDADERCYIAGRLKTRTKKDGEIEEYIHNPKYYTHLVDAVKGLVEMERRELVRKRDWSAPELLAAIRESDDRFCRLFELFEGEVLRRGE